ncbi:Uncharacterised protein [Bordetella ansorpii]|uniref:Uncharacterized protein n=1 Tax=Bordetella ansorpii TaxID=288768 RepID=A0A157QB94_9BORD|nr:Uncharacterised protein [Bordetella ansorpii]
MNAAAWLWRSRNSRSSSGYFYFTAVTSCRYGGGSGVCPARAGRGPLQPYQAPNANIFGWLGTMRMPIVLMPFWVLIEVRRVVGAQRFR